MTTDQTADAATLYNYECSLCGVDSVHPWGEFWCEPCRKSRGLDVRMARTHITSWATKSGMRKVSPYARQYPSRQP